MTIIHIIPPNANYCKAKKKKNQIILMQKHYILILDYYIVAVDLFIFI